LQCCPPLSPDEKEEELALNFDHLLLTMQLALVEQTGISDSHRDKLTQYAQYLEGKTSVPAVAEQIEWIEYVQSTNFWMETSLEDLEQTRRRLRLLIHLIKKEKLGIVYTNFKDELLGIKENSGVYNVSPGTSLALYRKKVEAYIKANLDNLTIQRIKRNLPITKLDLKALEDKLFDASGIGDLAEYEATIHPDKSLGVFVRELVGLDRGAAKEAFAEYLDEAKFNSQQIHFVNTIIDYLTQNGVMNPSMLAKAPFTDIHFEGVFGLFDDNVVIGLRNTVKRVEALAVGE
jgi:type I restriction enzyme R subunit